VRGLVGDAEAARDIAQDVFVDAWRATTQGTPPFAEESDSAGIRRWLFHAAYCEAVSLLRHRAVIAWQPLDAASGPASNQSSEPTRFEVRVVEGDALRSALDSLASDEAAALLLHIVHGFTSAEISAVLEIAPTAVRKRLSRAMQRLRAAYFAQERGQDQPRKDELRA
jgi:RNA polymerase sigma factor (sigma-70 family)